MFELETVPQSWTQQVHIGLRIALYNSNLFSIDNPYSRLLFYCLCSSSELVVSWLTPIGADRPASTPTGSIRPAISLSRSLRPRERETERGEGFLISDANCADRPSEPAEAIKLQFQRA